MEICGGGWGNVPRIRRCVEVGAELYAQVALLCVKETPVPTVL
jgi:hypothetical protein